jgi:hypothetical protein
MVLGLPSPSMVVALLALGVAAGGVAAASIPGPDGAIRACVADDGQIGIGAPLVPYAVPKGSLRVIDSGASCGSGETPLMIAAPQPPVSGDPTLALAARTKKAKRLGSKLTAVTSTAVAAGQHLVMGTVRISHARGLNQDQRVKCAVLGNRDKVVPGSTVSHTFEKGADAGDVTIPINTIIQRAQTGPVRIACQETAAASGGRAKTAGARSAQVFNLDAASPGLLAANQIVIPVTTGINTCGVDVGSIGGVDALDGLDNNACTLPPE